jgi:hypothetical protein
MYVVKTGRKYGSDSGKNTIQLGKISGTKIRSDWIGKEIYADSTKIKANSSTE